MIYVMLPVYNERGNIRPLIGAFAEVFPAGGYRIVAVNDGSSDGSSGELAALAGSHPLTVIDHPRNLGLGKALATGFSHAFSVIKPGDVLVTMDADDTHRPETALAMLREVDAGKDIVIASRFCAQGGAREVGLSAVRKLYSRMARAVLTLIFPYPELTDYTCGYRAFAGGFVLRLRDSWGARLVTERGFTATAEILLKSLRLRPALSEVPLDLRYDRKKGKSKMKPLRTILRYLVLVARTKVSS